MKRFLTSFVAAVALTALVTVQAQAQVKRDKQPPGGLGDLTKPVKGGTAAKSLPDRDRDVLGVLTIKSFGIFTPKLGPTVPGPAYDSGFIVGVISSNAAQPLPATYTFSSWNGKTWTTIGESKTVTVPATKTVDVRPPFPSGTAPERLRLVVTNTIHKVHQVQELKLAAIARVRCRAVDWVPVDVKGVYWTEDRAKTAADLLKYFGFEVEHRRIEAGTSVRLGLYARLGEATERSYYSQMWADMHTLALWNMLYGGRGERDSGKVEVIRR